MRALSIRQPWAELILRGIKTIEVRSINTKIRERFYIYASLGRVWEEDEVRIQRAYDIDVDGLPRGVIVGTVELVDCRQLKRADSAGTGFRVTDTDGQFAWCLARPERVKSRKPKGQPQPVWFIPF